MFPNARLCKAMLDRLTDQAHIVETGTESYRFRRMLERKKRKGEKACFRLRRQQGFQITQVALLLLQGLLQHLGELRRHGGEPQLLTYCWTAAASRGSFMAPPPIPSRSPVAICSTARRSRGVPDWTSKFDELPAASVA